MRAARKESWNTIGFEMSRRRPNQNARLNFRGQIKPPLSRARLSDGNAHASRLIMDAINVGRILDAVRQSVDPNLRLNFEQHVNIGLYYTISLLDVMLMMMMMRGVRMCVFTESESARPSNNNYCYFMLMRDLWAKAFFALAPRASQFHNFSRRANI